MVEHAGSATAHAKCKVGWLLINSLSNLQALKQNLFESINVYRLVSEYMYCLQMPNAMLLGCGQTAP